MEPRIIERGEIILVGTAWFCDSVGPLWRLYQKLHPQVKNIAADVGLEFHVYRQEYVDGNRHFCMTGIEVSEVADLPLELCIKRLPPAQYAVFTRHFGTATREQAYAGVEAWLRENGYADIFYDLQYYDDRYKGEENPESEVDIWVPLSKKGASNQ